jgi:aspartate aminotransferase-like enzyme
MRGSEAVTDAHTVLDSAAPSAAARPPAGAQTARVFVPGPSWVRAEVLQAMTEPPLPHRGAEFKARYARVAARLPALFRTAGDVMVASGSGTLAMQAAVASTVERDVLHLTNGAFSERWHAIGLALGKQADRVSAPWGEPVDPELVRRALRRKRYEAVTVAHSETSTGVLNPVAEIARAVREESDALVLVDAVSSLAGAPVETDAWDLDLVLTSSQKALALPPGIALFTLSERAAERAEAVSARGWYTDLLRYRDEHRGGTTITTPCEPVFFALELQLEAIAAEGVEARWERHRRMAERTREWAAARGLACAAAAGFRSPTVTCLRPPAGVAAPELGRRAKSSGFLLGGGYGEWKETTFRIGHMGDVGPADLEALLAALDDALAEGS